MTRAFRDAPEVLPYDEHNQRLIANVHPQTWVNPAPSGRYHLVVIGAGTAGLISAAVAAGLGAKVALVERHLMGGDCLNVGCVPSKALIRAARAAAEVARAASVDARIPHDAGRDFHAAMERVRRLRAEISDDDSARRYSEELGVDVYLGQARFTGRTSIEVGGTALDFRRAVIATGARASAPPIAGLEDAGYLSNETLFELTEAPPRLAVIGAGPIGCEMAQAFQRLGSGVTLLEAAPRILIREDEDAAGIVQDAFRREGVDLMLGAAIQRVDKTPRGKRIQFDVDGRPDECFADEILVGVGRAPNVEGLDLEKAGVEHDATGVRVNDRLQTTNPRIFAAGDICMKHKFTHAADAAAKLVVRNALFPLGRQRVSDLVIPWCTYTDPEVAHVGLYAREAAEAGIETDEFEVPLSRINRAVLDGEDEGFVKVLVKKGTDQILGATIVAAHAGELISQVTLAMVGRVGLGRIAGVIYPYPTQSEGIKAAANAYMRTRLTPLVKRIFEFWLGLTG